MYLVWRSTCNHWPGTTGSRARQAHWASAGRTTTKPGTSSTTPRSSAAAARRGPRTRAADRPFPAVSLRAGTAARRPGESAARSLRPTRGCHQYGAERFSHSVQCRRRPPLGRGFADHGPATTRNSRHGSRMRGPWKGEKLVPFPEGRRDMAIDFTLTAGQKEIQGMARDFAQDVLAPITRDVDEEPDPLRAFQ